MVRSMYSGVSGMRSNQIRLDTIGNNVANVNTVGFKGSRVTFRDIYYQNMRSAAGASSNAGGTNPSQVGVGTQVASVDIMQNRSSFTQTDMGLDLAIDGEGFFQVQDKDGNKYFTRAGQLNFDSAGNLVDSRGNFVLGVSGDPTGKAPGSNLIQVALPSVNPAASTGTQKINGTDFMITASNNSKEGNVGFSFVSDATMPIGQKVSAEVGPSGIVVRLNASADFTSMADLNTEVNNAINSYMVSKTGSGHPAGTFTISSPSAATLFAGGPLTGKEICAPDFGVNRGSISGWTAGEYTTGGFTFKSVGDGFSATDALTSIQVAEKTAGTASPKTVTVVINGTTYTADITEAQANSASSILLKNANSNSDYIELGIPSGWSGIKETTTNGNDPADPVAPGAKGPWQAPTAAGSTWDATISKPSRNIGLSYSKFVLKGGTEGGPQGIESLTGVQIGTDGVISGISGEDGKSYMLGRIDLVTFANPAGLSQAGGTYFVDSANSGAKNYTAPGTGGSGATIAGSLELSNVDLSREFTDMIGTQRAYQASARMITVSDTMLEELVNLKR